MSKSKDPFVSGKYWTTSINCATGCTAINDPANPCLNCWARNMTRARPQVDGCNGFKPTFHGDRLEKLRTKKPEVVFVDIMGDWQHEAFSEQQRSQQTTRMGATPWSVFLTCTKRAERLAEYWRLRDVADNIWNGVTVWDQASAERNLEQLFKVPGKHWISYEPMLGPIVLPGWVWRKLDWVTLGPETVPGHRPAEEYWYTQILFQCACENVPAWVKAYQLPNGKITHDPQQFPDWMRSRKAPEPIARILRAQHPPASARQGDSL